MGDGPAAVQESGLGQGECPAAEGGEGDAPGVGAAQGVEHRLGRGRDVVVEPGNHDEVGTGEPGQCPVGCEGQAAP